MDSSLLISKEPTENSRPIFHIEILTENKNAWTTFEKLFTLHQRKNCFDNEITITLREINSLFMALNQKIDPTQGKGSHKKITLNLQDINSDSEEQMIILTNTINLKEYQLKQIREAFVKQRVVPRNPIIIAKLKEDGLLD